MFFISVDSKEVTGANWGGRKRVNSIGLFSGNHDVYYRKSTRFVKNFLRCARCD